MTMRNLQVFVKVAECGKMSLAAKQLYISQSAISQAITEIEREYGVVLFDRIGKQLYITSTGRELLEYARQAIAFQESIHTWLSQNSSRKKLRVGVTMTVGDTIFCTLLDQLKERCPGIHVSSFIGNTERVEEKLLNGELDIGLVEGDISSPYISSSIVIDDHLVLVCGKDHRLFGRDSVSIHELQNEHLLMREHGSGTRAQFMEKLEQYHIDYTEVMESCSSEAIKQCVIAGHGISVLSERLVEAEVRSGRLWRSRIREFPMCRHFSLTVYKSRAITDTMKLFEQICRELYGSEAT